MNQDDARLIIQTAEMTREEFFEWWFALRDRTPADYLPDVRYAQRCECPHYSFPHWSMETRYDFETLHGE